MSLNLRLVDVPFLPQKKKNGAPPWFGNTPVFG